MWWILPLAAFFIFSFSSVDILQSESKPDFSKIEKEAMQRADRTLSTIENFLLKWDSSKQKPSSMTAQISKVKRFYEALSVWQKSTLKAQKSKFDEAAAKKRLANFVHICQNYS